MAPAWRSLTKLSGTAVEPPVTCMPSMRITVPTAPRAASACQLSSVLRNGTDSSAVAVL